MNAKSSNEYSSVRPLLPQVTAPISFSSPRFCSPVGVEKLQAVSSPWTRWINTINAQYVTGSDGLQDKLGISGKHASGYHAVAHIAYCCSHLPRQQKIPSFAALNKFLDQDTTPSKTLQRDMVDVMKKFTQIATTDKLRLGFSQIPQKVAPVEFVYIGQPPAPFCVPTDHTDCTVVQLLCCSC